MKRTVLNAAALLMLVSCGGKGNPPAAPVLNWAPASVKSFVFTWADVKGEKQYWLLEDPDGVSGYSPVGVVAANAVGYTLANVSLATRINARYILQACNSAGCTDSAPVFVAGDLAAAAGYVKASNTAIGDAFGLNLALSADGDTLAVAAGGEDSAATGVDGDQADNTATSSGAVYVFTRSGNNWSQQAYLKASNTAAADQFGLSLALSGDGSTLAVGAPAEDSAATGVDGDQADNAALTCGAVYVFTRSGTAWSQQAYVKASNTANADQFGANLALSADGNTLAVGASGEDSIANGVDGNQADNTAPTSGAVYVFTRAGSAWSQQAYVKASNTAAGDQFGFNVALSANGSTLAVAANGEDSIATGVDGDQADNAAATSGAVYVFTRSGGTWSQQAYVKASNTGAGDQFGSNLAMSADGSTLAVAAVAEDSAATGVDGDQADNTATTSGAVYVFIRNATTWSQQAYVKASNSAASDQFGISLALSANGHTLAVTAPFEDSIATGVGGDQADNTAPSSGAAYLFTRSGTAWSQRAYVKASNTASADQFGFSTALSGDGGTLVVGANGEDGGTTGLNGDQADNTAATAGAVYLY